ncbi:MAG: hypothetical protein ACYCYR_02215 [Desulfobulbaceae bacterium]|jgi:hypothetical protein
MTGEKDTISEELANLRDEMIRDSVRDAIAENPGNVREANLDLLADLIFLHEFDRNLQELIAHLTKACQLEDDPQRFSDIALEFYRGTEADGYHALAALQEIFDEDSDKRKIVDFLISEATSSDQEEIEF